MSDNVDVQQSEPAQPPASTPPVKPEETAKYWQDKFNGAQGYMKQLEQQVATLTSERDALKTDKETFAAEAAKHENDAKTATQTAEQRAAELTQAQAEAAKFKREADIATMLMKPEFSALQGLYQEGLIIGLENMADEEISGFFTRYVNNLGLVAQQSHQVQMQGTVPTRAPAGGQQQPTVDELRRQYTEASRKFGSGSKEAKEAYARYETGLRSVK